MNHVELPALSQEAMETWFQQITTQGSRLLRHGVVSKIKPEFVNCNYKEQTVELVYDVLEWQLNPQNVIHGGMIATAFDTTLGLLCHYYTKPHVVTTVSLNTTYHKPVFLGDTFLIKAKLEFQGRSLCSIAGEAWIKNGTILAASASSIFKILKETQNNPLI